MNVVFLVAFPFPYGEASSIRALNLCRLMHFAGYDVHVICDFLSDHANVADPFCTYESCLKKQPPIYKRFLRPKASLQALADYCENHKVDCVFANARSDRFFALVNYCNKKHLPLYIENCEWYDISSYKLGVIDWRYYINQRMLQEGFKKVDGFVSISRLLHDHNPSFGPPSVRHPTIMDVSKVDYSPVNNNSVINLVYTGSPGTSKEYLGPIISAFSQDEELQRRVAFHIYGPDRKTIIKNIGEERLLEKTRNCVFIHGRVAQEKMPGIMLNADYLIFIRPDRRSSNAGFPTKFGESMSAATPVITNDTGDIGLYLKDGVNGFLLEEGTDVCVKETLKRIAALSPEEAKEMRMNARKTAEQHFDFRAYTEDIQSLLKE